MKLRVLVIDDDDKIRSLLKEYLEMNDFEVKVLEDASSAGSDDISNVDVIVLDAMMPKSDGFAFLQKIRDEGCKVKVIMLTAKADIEDKLRGFESGADDYLPKPFDPRELLYRVQSIANRSHKKVSLGNSIFYPDTGKLVKGDVQEILSDSDVSILKLLIKNVNETVTREELINAQYACVGERSIDVQINRLRKKIEEDPKKPKCICTVRHIGYKLVSD